MNRKFTFLIPIITLLVTIFVGCTVNSSGTTTTNKSDAFALTQLSTSTTSITISWPTQKGGDYIVKVYGDEAMTDLRQQYTLLGIADGALTLSVPFLDCVNSYNLVVEDPEGYTSTPLLVALENDTPRRNIFSQNFDNLCWGYDYINSANGLRLNNDIEQKLSTYSIDKMVDSYEDCHIVTKPEDEGGQLFACSEKLRELMGLKGWSGTKASIYIRPGYIKLGNAYTTTCKLVSPAFSAIGAEESANVDLSLDACIYDTSANGSDGEATISIVKGDGTKLWSQTISLDEIVNTPKWKNFAFNINNVTSDCHFEIEIGGKTKQICFDNLKIVRKLEIPKGHIYGYVSDKSTGEPIEGVAISDGFSVTLTDQDGFYSMLPNKDCYYVFYTLPSAYKITIGGNGLPKFFTRYSADVSEYNFALRKLENGPEEKFALFGLGDPQVSSKTKLGRFKKEAVPGIAAHVESLGIPCYGITLGDVISNSSGSNSEAFREEMRSAMNYKTIGMPVFQVMGNHDANYYDENSPIEPDSHSSNYNIRAQREFERVNGPINYSFNRGNIHIIGMRDIVYNSQTSMANYTGGFLDSQYEWLKQDLAVVSKSMTVVLCVHIPLHNYRIISAVNHIGKVHQLLNEFQEAHIISGHTHYNRNAEPSSSFKNIYEHNVGTVCGTWWASTVCGDGTPNGFSVFIGEGTGFSEWYYMGYNEGMNTRDYQMRLYRGNAVTGSKIVDNKNGVEGYYSFNFGEDVVLANVFNADSKWKISVYEDGEYSGDMKKISDTSASYTKEMVGSYTFEDPRRIKDGVVAANDMWVVGYHMGVLDRYSVTNKEPSNGSWTANTHMYQYKLKNKNAKVKVVAIDRFGYRYESDKFVDYRDNKMAQNP